jgi:hypothetical protein
MMITYVHHDLLPNCFGEKACPNMNLCAVTSIRWLGSFELVSL